LNISKKKNIITVHYDIQTIHNQSSPWLIEKFERFLAKKNKVQLKLKFCQEVKMAKIWFGSSTEAKFGLIKFFMART